MKNRNVFVYGTLSFPEIISVLLGRTTTGIPARIDGYKRIRIKDKLYPGLIADKGKLNGVLHQDVTDEELCLLDAFEDDFYERITATIQLPDNRHVAAQTYIIPEENISFATDELWDRDGFAREYVGRYIQMVSQYRKDYLRGHVSSQNF